MSATSRRPPLRIVADTTLTPSGGSAVVGERCRGLGLVEVRDRAIDGVPPFTQRRAGVSAGELIVSMAESRLAGGDAVNDLEDLHADQAGAKLRAVAAVPAASRAAQLASASPEPPARATGRLWRSTRHRASAATVPSR